MVFVAICFLLLNLNSVVVGKSPNFLIFLTDDQDLLLNGLVPMNRTREMVANYGSTLVNYFVNSPICCPSRSTILTGKYAHNTGVTNNSISGNCYSVEWQRNFEPYTIASILKNHNYTTFYAGKYLNQYKGRRVPPGYDWWLGLEGNSKYYNYSLIINGTQELYGDNYLTDNLRDWALKFLDDKPRDSPFFMLLAPPAPHAPFTPAQRHAHEFTNITAPRTPAFNCSATNKHWLVEMPPNVLPTNVDNLDTIHRKRQQTLLAVDEMVEQVVKKLELIQQINDTYVIFTSDNGFHIGQFTQPWDKRQPYDTDIRVPFLIRGPKIRLKTVIDYPASAVDLAPTIIHLAQINYTNFDGKSFKKQLFKNPKKFHKIITIEYWGESNKSIDNVCRFDENLAQCSRENWCKCADSSNNTYTCILQISEAVQYKYCQFYDDITFLEAYDLIQDPYELNNLIGKIDEKSIKKWQLILNEMRDCWGNNCSNYDYP